MDSWAETVRCESAIEQRNCEHLLVREDGLELGHLAHEILGQAVHEVRPLPANSHVCPLQVAGGCPVAQRSSGGLVLAEVEVLAVPELLNVLPA